MIDNDDADTFWLFAMVTDHPVIWMILFLIAIALSVKACQNEDTCAQKQCDRGTAKLMDHECLCVETAR